jgi:hypothetical protein
MEYHGLIQNFYFDYAYHCSNSTFCAIWNDERVLKSFEYSRSAHFVSIQRNHFPSIFYFRSLYRKMWLYRCLNPLS